MAGRASEGVSRDGILGRRLILAQPLAGPRASDDAVLLAAAVPAKAGETAIDLGCGPGAAMLCLAWRVAGLAVTGLEIDAGLAGLAAENIAANGFSGRAAVVIGDVAAPPRDLGSADHVLLNPPFFQPGRHDAAPDPVRARARREAGDIGLDRWLATARAILRPGGSITVIHRAERTAEIVGLLPGAVAVLPLAARPGTAPKRVIVQARPDSSDPRIELEPFALHRAEDGRYCEVAEAILRHGGPLSLR